VKYTRVDKQLPVALKEMQASKCLQTPFLIHSCDVLIEEVDWTDVLQEYLKRREQYSVIGMFLCSQIYPLEIGVIREDKRKIGLALKFEEKPKDFYGSYYVHVGVFVLEPEFTKFIDDSDNTLERSSIPRAMGSGRQKFAIYPVGKWHHIHGLEAYYGYHSREQ
jgi:NDP-sugar pyrophosphorylase family protein